MEVNYKACTVCGRNLPATEEYFTKTNQTKSGITARCRQCATNYSRTRDYKYEERKEYYRQYYENNKSHIAQRAKAYRESNKELFKKRGQAYRKNNSDYVYKYNKKWYEDNICRALKNKKGLSKEPQGNATQQS